MLLKHMPGCLGEGEARKYYYCVAELGTSVYHIYIYSVYSLIWLDFLFITFLLQECS